MKIARLAPSFALLPVLLLGSAAPAAADDTTDAAAALKQDLVYEASGVDLFDEGALKDDLRNSDPQVYVAALPASAASTSSQAVARAEALGRAIGNSDAVVLVVTANRHLGAATGKAAGAKGVDGASALTAELADFSSQGKPFDKDNLTAFASDFQQRIENQASDGGSSGNGGATSDGGTNDGGSSVSSSGTSHTGRNFLLVLLALGGGGFFLAKRSSRQRRERQNNGLRADVVQLYDRLGSDVSTLDAKGDPVATQALADAAERYNACGSALSTAQTPEEFAAARRSAVEGLTAARTAREKLGLDPGPEIPLAPGSGPQLSAAERVRFQDQDYDGSPTYRPGYQHYYGGGMLNGQMVPGGWYSQPFWTPFLLGSMMSGGFGGGLFGGGYGYGGGGYGAGYEEGREDARDEYRDDNSGSGNGGGDWGGGGGGGDWGGGGGDWGGGGGGGDFGGGGGGGDW